MPRARGGRGGRFRGAQWLGYRGSRGQCRVRWHVRARDTGYTCVGNSAARNYGPMCSGDFGHQRQLQILAAPPPHAPDPARHPRTVHARTAGRAHVNCAAGAEPLHTGTRREDLPQRTSAARRRLATGAGGAPPGRKPLSMNNFPEVAPGAHCARYATASNFMSRAARTISPWHSSSSCSHTRGCSCETCDGRTENLCWFAPWRRSDTPKHR